MKVTYRGTYYVPGSVLSASHVLARGLLASIITCEVGTLITSILHMETIEAQGKSTKLNNLPRVP